MLTPNKPHDRVGTMLNTSISNVFLDIRKINLVQYLALTRRLLPNVDSSKWCEYHKAGHNTDDCWSQHDHGPGRIEGIMWFTDALEEFQTRWIRATKDRKQGRARCKAN